ncbi:ATP-binding protein [Halioxenophilus sp. WMMB6]|uniref:ATP-binding protein n=1 Tax=Halioxenophilus sp. WMMB6 TaxID=3073815 RepID=UPI00295E6088|nr:ATP-binding protein [Halioxenophilus sp. WMMB6]
MAISLRRRLTIILLGQTLITWVIAVLVTTLYSQKLIDKQIASQLNNYMDVAQHTLATVLSNPAVGDYFFDSKTATLSEEEGISRIRGFGIQGRGQATNLWFPSRQILVGEEAPRFPRYDQEGVKDVNVNGTTWRVLYRYSPKIDVHIAVGVDLSLAEQMGILNLWQMIVPLFFILPIATGILLWSLGRGLHPLRALASNIAARKPQALEPINAEGVPAEIKTVVDELNQLLARLSRALASESRFTANAAHELQTPLAAIKTEVQRCQRQIDDPQVLIMMERIARRVARASETILQLLTLARLGPDQEFKRESVRLDQLLLEVLADLGVMALDRAMEFKLPEPLPAIEVQGQREWLQILLHNIVRNALVHGQSPGVIEVQLSRSGSAIVLVVANDCEAITPEQFERLAESFYRVADNQREGVGLGLSIVQRIAQIHNIKMAYGPRESGLGFQIILNFPG